MSKILKVRNVNDYARYVGCAEQHPLVSVIDYAEVSPVRHSLNDYGVYGIFFHDEAEIDLAYGCGEVMLTGWALLFHPDLLHGFPLEKRIREYSFFDYRINEALHMTEEEHDILASLMRQIREELGKKPDELQRAILVGYIELALNFCQPKTASSIPLACPQCSIAPTNSACRPTISAMSSRKPPETRRATTSASSSSSLPRTGWRQGKPSPKYPTASASNIPSTSAGCSRSRRGLRRRNIVRGCGVNGCCISAVYLANSPLF